jgi:hypothetical protein
MFFFSLSSPLLPPSLLFFLPSFKIKSCYSASNWPWTGNLPASASWALGLQICITTLSWSRLSKVHSFDLFAYHASSSFRLGIFQAWFLDWEHQQKQGTCQKCTFSGPQTYWVRNSGVGPSTLLGLRTPGECRWELGWQACPRPS